MGWVKKRTRRGQQFGLRVRTAVETLTAVSEWVPCPGLAVAGAQLPAVDVGLDESSARIFPALIVFGFLNPEVVMQFVVFSVTLKLYWVISSEGVFPMNSVSVGIDFINKQFKKKKKGKKNLKRRAREDYLKLGFVEV